VTQPLNDEEISMPVPRLIRSEQVGSLLRPVELFKAAAQYEAGELDLAGLRAAQDQAIIDVIERQKNAGIDVLTDGEYRRTGFITGFMDAVDGFARGPSGP